MRSPSLPERLRRLSEILMDYENCHDCRIDEVANQLMRIADELPDWHERVTGVGFWVWETGIASELNSVLIDNNRMKERTPTYLFVNQPSRVYGPIPSPPKETEQ